MIRYLSISFLLSSWPSLWAAENVSYAREVLPILSENCFFCHGPDEKHREEGLRLDIRENAIEAFAWNPDKPEESEALIRIFSIDEDEMMPPPDSHRSLSAAQKQLLKTWIEQGAEYQTHWSFIAPPKTIPVPITKAESWIRTPIDAFVLARLDKEALEPSPEASPERWLRRVTFTLTGLPPTQAEIADFLADASPQAYETVVDRLLASPRFGEHMATPWLDIARYADSFGYQADLDTRAWPYRDWVIRAFNNNLPFDQFIIQQLAGDLLPDATREQKLATAFNRIHRMTNEGGSIPEEYRQEGIADRVHTTGTAFMALTFDCARCHDHKYDPISAKEYYSMGAFFNSIDEWGMTQGGNRKGEVSPQPTLQLPTPEQETRLRDLQQEITGAEATLAAHIKNSESAFDSWFSSAKSYPSPDLVAHYDFEERSLKNSVKKGAAANFGGNRLAPGKHGNALLANGDSPVRLPDLKIRQAHQAFSFTLWLKPAETYPQAIVFSKSTNSGGNYSGYTLALEHGRLRWTLAKEFPGCAASIESVEPVPTGQWTHVAVTNDGSRKASGMKIFINGTAAATTVICDNFTKEITLGERIVLSAKGSQPGLRGGMVDDFSVHLRAITALEIAKGYDENMIGHLPRDDFREYYFSAIDPEARELSNKISAARAAYRTEQDKVQEIVTMRESAEPRPAYLLERGEYTAPGEKVERETPDWLPPFPEDQPRNRLGFAKWLTSPEHPLTARVMVNRIWQEIFGTGIVETSDNFGIQGKQPTHPELLDWLARDFINHGWDHKRAIRQMVLSATFAQDSMATPELRERDPANELLARGPVRRLSAEQLRDSALALSGLLAEKIGGPPVKPYQAPGSMWKTLNNFLPVYKPDAGEGLYRRSLYTFWRRTTTPPNMMIFDSSARDVCATRRQATNTPLQPLVMLNDPQFVEAARKLGERILKEGGETDDSRAKWAYREVTGRDPSFQQLPILLEFISEQRAFFATKSSDAAALLKVGDSKPDATLDPVESATFASLAQALLNLDANITLR